MHEIYADEGITGTSTKKRLQFNRMIREAREGQFSLILTKEVSRFSRNILDTIAYTRELKSLGVGVLFLTDGISTMDPDAELRLSIMASIAQEESRRTSSRVVWGQTRQMERGVVFGPSLLGYDVKDGRIFVNAEGAELVRLIFHKYAREHMGAGRIARYLTEAGYQTFGGGTVWNGGSVLKILKNEKYAGDLVQKKSYTPDYLTHEKKRNTGQVPLIRIENHHEPIVSRELWNAARDRLWEQDKHRARATRASGQHPFSGKIRCGECGGVFVARYRYRSDGTALRRWCCSTAARDGTAGCAVGKLLREDDAVQMVQTVLHNLPMDRASLIRGVAALAMEAIRAESGSHLTADRLTQEIDRVRQKREAVMDSFFSGDITKEDMMAMKDRYTRQLQELQERLSRETERQKTAGQQACPQILESNLSALLNGAWESGLLYRTILDRITVCRDRHLELRLKGLSRVFFFDG